LAKRRTTPPNAGRHFDRSTLSHKNIYLFAWYLIIAFSGAMVRPRILVVSEGVMSRAHGTGAVFLRNFSRYPKELLSSAYVGEYTQGGEIPRAIDLNSARWPRGINDFLRSLPARIRNRLVPAWPVALPINDERIKTALKEFIGQTDLLYVICFSSEGMTVAESVAKAIPNVPLILHFYDFSPSKSASFKPLLKKLSRRACTIWCISATMDTFIKGATGRQCDIIDPPLYGDLPSVWKLHYEAYSHSFRVAVIGNIWNPDLIFDLKAIWREVLKIIPEIHPILWYCNLEAVNRLRNAGYDYRPEIIPAGFLRDQELAEAIARVDIAIIPFCRGEQPSNDYERYSLPSRITEIAGAGLPILALTGQNTPLAAYVENKKIGCIAPASMTALAASKLVSLILDVKLRETFGRNSRRLAEKDLQLNGFQIEFYKRLSNIAFKNAG
jgi:hypothetical protein